MANVAKSFVVSGVRLGSGVFVPGHGTVLNYPGRFSDAHVAALLKSGTTLIESDAVSPLVSVHSYEPYPMPEAPVHLSDEWEETDRESADTLSNTSMAVKPAQPVEAVEVTELTTKKAIVPKSR